MRHSASLQVAPDGTLKHLLTTEGLPAATITRILDTADQFVSVSEREVKKVPLLRGKSIFNVFFENSTRTRTTFSRAAWSRIGAPPNTATTFRPLRSP